MESVKFPMTVEVMLPRGGVMTVECTPEFMDRVQSTMGYCDDAAIRQFIHDVVKHALQDTPRALVF